MHEVRGLNNSQAGSMCGENGMGQGVTAGRRHWVAVVAISSFIMGDRTFGQRRWTGMKRHGTGWHQIAQHGMICCTNTTAESTMMQYVVACRSTLQHIPEHHTPFCGM